MTDNFHAIEAKEKTKRAAYWSKALIAAISLGAGGFGTFLFSPKSITAEQMEVMLDDKLKPIKEELAAHESRIAEAKYNADRANRDTDTLRIKLDKDLAKLDRVMEDVSDIRESVARIDERTKKGGT